MTQAPERRGRTMKKHMLLISNLIIILSIMVGFLGMAYTDTQTYQNLAENNLENTLSLADVDISKHIENSMSKPVMVSKTMANDEFLKAWLMQENTADNARQEQLYTYLKTYQEKYDYTTVFCVSAKTGNYYYQDGLNKTVSKNDPHDVWYYNFVNSKHEYDLEIDTNQANNDNIAVFVNFRVEGDDGSLLGIIGVGLQVDFVEKTIRSYEKDYGLSVYIINEGGSQNSFTGDTDIFINREDLAKRTGINETIAMDQSEESKMQWFTSGAERKCLITKYDKTLRWYLVLEKETNSISSSFQERLKSNIIFMLVSLAVCILVTTGVFFNYNRRMIAVENTDELTGLLNRKLFTKQYPSFIRRHPEQKKTLFMFDIDHFKTVNDTYGHLFGNAILSMVGEELRKVIDGHGMAVRWGGDEFLGILTADTDEAQQILARFMEAIKNEEKDDRYNVTVSVGIAELSGKPSIEEAVKRADQALYRSKKDGRNRITVFEEEVANV